MNIFRLLSGAKETKEIRWVNLHGQLHCKDKDVVYGTWFILLWDAFVVSSIRYLVSFRKMISIISKVSAVMSE